MPWDIVRNEQGKHCVYKVDAAGQPVGEAVACHNTVEQAQSQVRALYANEGKRDAREAQVVEARVSNPQGKVWDVTLIGPDKPEDLLTIEGREYVLSKNGRAYSVEALRNSAPIWEGIKVYDNHLTDAEFEQRGRMRSVGKEWLGSITNVRFDEPSRCLRGQLHVVDKAIQEKLLEAHAQGVLNTIGLSIDTEPHYGDRPIEYAGMSLPVVEIFHRVHSVDLVAEPAAGGRLERPIEAAMTNDSKRLEVSMDEKLMTEVQQMVQAAVTQAVDALSAKAEEAAKKAEPKGEDEMTDEEKAALVEKLAAAKAKKEAEEAPAENASEPKADDKVAALEAQVKRMACQAELDRKISAAKLTGALEATVRKAFEGRVFESAALDETIKEAKKAQAESDPTGKVQVAGAARESVAGIKGGLTPEDKIETEFLRLMLGNTGFRALAQSKDDFVRERFTEAYRAAEKAGFPNYGTRRLSEWVYNAFGDPLTGQRASESVTTANMTSIVKNAVNVVLANDYSIRERWWEPIVRTEEVDTIDQATLVRVYGMDTLDVVSEGAAYTELNWADEEETAAFVKKGNYLGITMETLLSDKLNVIRTIPQRLANAWYNTLSALVSGVFTTNSSAGPVLADTGALFNATAITSTGGHANLLTTALSYSQLVTVETAMMKQTDQTLGTGRRLGIRPRYILVPYDLVNTAETIRDSERIPNSANNDTNKFRGRVEVIGVPDWTDANNWAAVADPQQFPAIWTIFYRGQRVPQLFEATNDTSGAMFTNDTLMYKVRMLTFRFSSTYDCAPVSDWRALHKSNVA